MNNPEDVLEAARNIKPLLSTLLGSEAITVDQALGDLLAKVDSDEAIANQILKILEEREPTREWTRQFLIDKNGRLVNLDPAFLKGLKDSSNTGFISIDDNRFKIGTSKFIGSTEPAMQF